MNLNKLEIGLTKFRHCLNRTFPHAAKSFFSTGIITAAGSGQRMGGISKQLLPVGGKPCIVHSLLAFQNCKDIHEIIVVAKDSEITEMETICRDHHISKLKAIVPGGDTRQASVTCGFHAVSPKSVLVAIHDAARPMIKPEHISILLEDARRWGAACAAKKMTDTVKRVGENGFIKETVPRDDLYTVQTPQVFKTDLYRVSLALAEKDEVIVTDDCALAEHAGFSVKLRDLAIHNPKITTQADLDLVNSMFKER